MRNDCNLVQKRKSTSHSHAKNVALNPSKIFSMSGRQDKSYTVRFVDEWSKDQSYSKQFLRDGIFVSTYLPRSLDTTFFEEVSCSFEFRGLIRTPTLILFSISCSYPDTEYQSITVLFIDQFFVNSGIQRARTLRQWRNLTVIFCTYCNCGTATYFLDPF